MTDQEITLKFENADARDAGIYARELKDDLENDIPDLQISLEKDSQDNMDFGATLILILGAPVVVEIAKGIANWLARRPNSEIVIECGGKKVRFAGSSEDAAKIAESLKQACD